MMIRLLHKLNQEDGWNDYDIVIDEDQPKKRYFQDLLSHKDDMFADPLTVHAIKGVHRIAQDYLQEVPSLDEFAEIYGRMAINGFEICDEFGNNRAWGIYLGQIWPWVLGCQTGPMGLFQADTWIIL